MEYLTKTLDVYELFAYMIQERVLTTRDVEIIKAETVKADQVLKFVTILMTKGPEAFNIFLESLKESQEHVYKSLTRVSSSASIGMSLLNFHFSEHVFATMYH